MKSKIHRATVTEANIDYIGSVTISEDLMDAADILAYEQVHVLDVDNGSRLVTYAIPGPRGEGVICLNGAAARLVAVGDKVIIISYATLNEAELRGFQPRLVFVDANNRVVKTEDTVEPPRKIYREPLRDVC